MTIIESNGELALINTVRLNEKALKELDKLGTVKQIIRIGAFHGRDDAFYLDRYHADFLTTNMDNEIRNLSTQYLSDGFRLKQGQFFMFENSHPSEGFLYIDNHDGIIITSDSIKNWVEVDEFFSDETGKIATQSGEIAKACITYLVKSNWSAKKRI